MIDSQDREIASRHRVVRREALKQVHQRLVGANRKLSDHSEAEIDPSFYSQHAYEWPNQQ